MHGEVEAHATHDELTDFMNRKTFLQVVERALPDRVVSASGAVLCQISIDNLKEINGRHGIEVGDAVISMIAEVLQETLSAKSVSFGRLGGSEIGVFWRKGGVRSAYKKLQTCFAMFVEKNIEAEAESLPAVAYAGITSIQDGLTTGEQLLSVVADACGVAKSSNDKPIYVVGSENKYREQLEQMVSYIGKAHDRERLVLLHQSVTSLVSDDELLALHMVVTAEDRNGKLVPPGFFAQALANSDRAFEIDRWTLKSTFTWMADNSNDMDSFAAVIIPLSHEAVKRDDLANIIINELMETAVPPGKIFFEISDKDAITNVTKIAEFVRTLKEFGCRFILDEFGSGQRNYDYVKELAVDFVTIQSAYITEAKENQKDFAMAKSINELVHFMGKKTIGKQDSGADVVEVLREIGIDFLYDQSKTNRVAA
jgi:diguanylate cyclase (GGDEF)-like protein